MKLGYKNYPTKMSLGAMKQFNKETGLDLWAVLLEFIEVYNDTVQKKVPLVTQLRRLYQICNLFVGAELIHALVRAEDKSIDIAEIQDAMAMVGWRPSTEDDDMSQPWALVVVSLAFEIEAEFAKIGNDDGKKKVGT